MIDLECGQGMISAEFPNSIDVILPSYTVAVQEECVK
jgi:hypothetical protein